MIDALNLNHYFPGRVLDPASEQPAGAEHLAEVLCPSLAEMELSEERTIAVPGELRDTLAGYRPTPLYAAPTFAAALGGGCEVIVKDEGATPSGNHKMNSALWIAYHCARDGVRAMTTETTGNWGLALALAGSRFGIEVVCFLDARSAHARPDREHRMREAGAEVIVVGEEGDDYDPLVLSANAAVSWTKERGNSSYIFGSVYNYFILPQTLTGQEAMQELGSDHQPDVVVGSCGGGANLLGIASPFLVDRMQGDTRTRIVAAESELCPIVSEGVEGAYSVDDQGHYPKLRTYGIPRLLGDTYIGGLGSTIVAAPVAGFHQAGVLETTRVGDTEARDAALLFEKTEGRRVALETGYQLAAVGRAAQEQPGARILVNISSVALDSFA